MPSIGACRGSVKVERNPCQSNLEVSLFPQDRYGHFSNDQARLFRTCVRFRPAFWCQISANLASKQVKMTKNNQNNQD